MYYVDIANKKGGESVYQIMASWADAKNRNNVTLEQKVIDKVVADALQTIKNGLPEEAQTVEILEYIVSKLKDRIKECHLKL